MKWLIRILVALVVLALLGWFVVKPYLIDDGKLPLTSNYELNIDEYRQLVSADMSEAQYMGIELRVEKIGMGAFPSTAVLAGSGWDSLPMGFYAFQVFNPLGSTVIDTAMTEESMAAMAPDDGNTQYDATANERLQAAMVSAEQIFISHEHFDHSDGLMKHPEPESLAAKIMVTETQWDTLRSHSFKKDEIPTVYDGLAPLIVDGPTLVAPGIVAIPAAGHTPGSLIFYIQLQSGKEYLYVGDVAWHEANITKECGRPRLVQWFLLSPREDRAAVYNQLRALHDLKEEMPDLHIIAGHDPAQIESLVTSGHLSWQFR